MSDRTDDPMDWMEDEARFEAEDEADWKEAERRSAAEALAFDATVAMTDFCATEGCEGAGTEKLGDTYLCSACYQAAFQRAYDREREMGR